MPLPKRSIDPVHVARSMYQQDEVQSVELETVTNTTLTNIIRQLSSLSKHAEDVFGELAREVGQIGDRASSLQARIDRLSIKVTQLDSTVEEVPLTDITRKKAFKSAKNFDQQIFSRATMPAPMLETYAQCDKPPPLDKLNVYRDDGKDGLKFYTDPNYFFELWRQEMLKDTDRLMHDRGKRMHRPRQDGSAGGPGGGGESGASTGNATGRGHKKRVRKPHNTREKQRQIAIGHGETLMPNNVIYRTPNSLINEETVAAVNAYGTQIVKIRTVLPDNRMDPANLVTSDYEQDNDDQEAGVKKNKGSNSRRLFMPCSLEMMGIGVGDGKRTETGEGNNVLSCMGVGVYETRPARPNSIELRNRNYQTEHMDGLYGPLSPPNASNILHNPMSGQYAATTSTYTANGMLPAQHQTHPAAVQQYQQQQQHLQQQQQQQHHHQQQMYDDHSLYQQQQHQQQQQHHQNSGVYGQGGGPMSPDTIYAPGTPSRTKPRPSQPPPAPPANGSGSATPTTSNGNTPTRGRSVSTSRDALPPPPPIPDGMVNTTSPSQMLAAMNGGMGICGGIVGQGVVGVGSGSGHIAAKLLARTNSTSRAGSPQTMAPSNSVQDANALVMQQLSNTFNNLGMGGMMGQQQLNSLSDLPPPPPVPDQHSPKLSPSNAAPPPPPPPPPLDENGNGGSPLIQQQHSQPASHQIMPKSLPNGDIQSNGGGHLSVAPKKLLHPYHDTRIDLMEAIRHGITLRKVEKSEQKEFERSTAGLHDVASILARRVAIELSESEDSESEDDSEGWMEPNETSA